MRINCIVFFDFLEICIIERKTYIKKFCSFALFQFKKFGILNIFFYIWNDRITFYCDFWMSRGRMFRSAKFRTPPLTLIWNINFIIKMLLADFVQPRWGWESLTIGPNLRVWSFFVKKRIPSSNLNFPTGFVTPKNHL